MGEWTNVVNDVMEGNGKDPIILIATGTTMQQLQLSRNIKVGSWVFQIFNKNNLQ